MGGGCASPTMSARASVVFVLLVPLAISLACSIDLPVPISSPLHPVRLVHWALLVSSSSNVPAATEHLEIYGGDGRKLGIDQANAM